MEGSPENLISGDGQQTAPQFIYINDGVVPEVKKKQHTRKNLLEIEKITFLRRVMNNGIVLPSLDNRKFDMDLVLEQQRRKLQKQISEMHKNYRNAKNELWKNFSSGEKSLVWEKRLDKRQSFIRKYNWLGRSQLGDVYNWAPE